jgi:hypothetical protein
MFHFVLNDCIALDNRIPPAGFTGGTDLQLRPVGYTYPETFPGSGVLVNHDVTGYTIPVPPGTAGPVSVSATLRYQTASKEYVEFLLDESVTHGFPDDCIERTAGFPTQTRGEILYDMWNVYGKSAPVDVDSDTGSAGVPQTPGEAGTMLVTGRSGGQISVVWTPACGASDHTIYYGDLADVAGPGFSGQVCGAGAAGSAAFDPGPGDVFWVIVANDGSVEGSYGTDSAHEERTEDTTLSACPLPQSLTNRCD